MKKIFGLSVICSMIVFDFPAYSLERLLGQISTKMAANRSLLADVSADKGGANKNNGSGQGAASSSSGEKSVPTASAAEGVKKRFGIGVPAGSAKVLAPSASSSSSVGLFGRPMKRHGERLESQGVSQPVQKAAKVEVSKDDVSPEIMELLREQDQLRAREKELACELDTAKTNEAVAQSNVESLERDFAQLRREAKENEDRAQSEIERLNRTMDQMNEQHRQEIDEIYRKTTDEKKEMASHLSDAENQVRLLQAEKIEVEELLKKAQDAQAKSEEAIERRLKELESQLKEAQSAQSKYRSTLVELEELKKKLRQSGNQLEGVSGTKTRYAAALAELKAAEMRSSELEEQLKEAQSARAKLEEALKKRSEELEEQLKEAQSALAESEEALRKRSEELEDQLKKEGDAKVHYGTVLMEAEAVKANSEKLNGELKSLREELAVKDKELVARDTVFFRISELVNEPKDDGSTENVTDTDGLIHWVEEVKDSLKGNAAQQDICKGVLLEVGRLCNDKGVCKFDYEDYAKLDLMSLVSKLRLLLDEIKGGQAGGSSPSSVVAQSDVMSDVMSVDQEDEKSDRDVGQSSQEKAPAEVNLPSDGASASSGVVPKTPGKKGKKGGRSAKKDLPDTTQRSSISEHTRSHDEASSVNIPKKRW